MLTAAASATKWLDAARLVALVVLVVYLPALVLIALAVIFTSAGPAFVSRCYLRPNGQMVDLWEFRTECWERRQPTSLGRMLQVCGLHRLPALVNVLCGHVEAGEKVRVAQ